MSEWLVENTLEKREQLHLAEIITFSVWVFSAKYIYFMYTQTSRNIVNKNLPPTWVLSSPAALLEKSGKISLYGTDDAIAKLYVTKSLVTWKDMVEHFIT